MTTLISAAFDAMVLVVTQTKSRIAGLAAACLALVMLAATAGVASAQTSGTLFTPAGSSLSSVQNSRLQAIRQLPTTTAVEVVRVDVNALTSDRVIMSLPQLGASTATKLRTYDRGDNDYTWVGRFDDGGNAILVVKDGEITGNIQSRLNVYQVRPVGGGAHAIVKINPGQFPPDHPENPVIKLNSNDTVSPAAPSASVNDTSPNAISPAAVQLDVLVAYTTTAKNAYGGNMQTYAQLAVDTANTSYANSNTNTTLRLVGTREVNYSETSQTFDSMLDALMNSSNSEMAAVRTMRDTVGADMVGMMIGLSSSCGLASSISSTAANAYMVMYYNCVSNQSFEHEFGHLIGARHDPYMDPNTTPYAYGHGYVEPGNTWRTVMAYVNACGSCPRLPYFSNPSVTYGGIAMGTTGTNDNARVHRERATTVAAFRSAVSSNYTIAVSANPSNGGTVSGGGTYSSGASVTVNATANSGYIFSSWTESGTVVSWTASYTFSATANRTLVANFGVVGAPSAPTANAATNVTSSGFTANWSSSSGATGYRIDVATDSGFASLVYSNADIGNVTAVGVTALNSGTTYYYRLRAYNGSGTSGNSNTISVTTNAVAPANDNFANAITISGTSGSTTGTNVSATKESGEPQHAQFGGKSVWWKWTPASSGSVTIETTGSNYDTLLAVYTGSAVNSLALVASNDDSGGGTQSLVTFSAVAGTTYRIAVDGYNGSSPIPAQNPALAEEGSIVLLWNQTVSGAGSLAVSPSTNMVSLGPVGGPFNPSTFNYNLTASSGTVNWSISGVPDWLTPSATSGSASTSGTTVTFSVNTAALSKAVGAYGPTTITFTNTTNNQGNTTRTAGLTVSPVACEAIAKGPEFSGDSKGDILWRQDSGAAGMWFMNGTSLSSGVGIGTVSTDWRLIGSADFNGDGKSDLLWRNTTTGAVAIWFISGVTVTGTVNVATVGLDWKLVGAADFNGDGKADLLWRNNDGSPAIWLLNNGNLQSAAGFGVIGTDWRIVGVADFNGDGKADLLWRNFSGAAAIWLMNGTSLQSGSGLGYIATDWRIVGVGDFNGDGKADILWRNDNSTYAMWFMNGVSPTSTGTVGSISSDWHLAAVNDYNADGKADFLLRNDSGNLGIWLMNGASLVSAGGIAGIGYDWHIVNGEHDRPPVLIQPGPC